MFSALSHLLVFLSFHYELALLLLLLLLLLVVMRSIFRILLVRHLAAWVANVGCN